MADRHTRKAREIQRHQHAGMMEAQQKVIAAFDKGLNAKRIILGQNAVAKIAKAVPQSAQPVRHERNRKRMQSVRAINAESIGGQADRIDRAVQQLRAEPQVQRPDAAAERGLCHVVRLGRARKAARPQAMSVPRCKT